MFMKPSLSEKALAIVKKMQQNELTESVIYEKIAAFAKGDGNRETLLRLSKEEKAECCRVITQMMKEGAPVFNLRSAFPYLINNRFPTPCHQCVVMENGKISTCGRCIEVPELCQECGYFFVAEYTLLFRGNPKILFEMLRTYLKYI